MPCSPLGLAAFEVSEAVLSRTLLRARPISAWLNGRSSSHVRRWAGHLDVPVNATAACTPGLLEARGRRLARAGLDVKRLAALDWSRHHRRPLVDAA